MYGVSVAKLMKKLENSFERAIHLIFFDFESNFNDTCVKKKQRSQT